MSGFSWLQDSACAVAILTTSVFSLVSISSIALAEDAPCYTTYRFMGNQRTPGTLDIKAGTACRSLFFVNAVTRVDAIQVLARPKYGTVSTDPSGFRYRAKPGYQGKDSMTLRFVGRGAHGRGAGIIDFLITVQ